MRVRKKGFDFGYLHSEDKFHRGGKSTKKSDRIWQRNMRRKLKREAEKTIREQEVEE